jgi:hypothetical protein
VSQTPSEGATESSNIFNMSSVQQEPVSSPTSPTSGTSETGSMTDYQFPYLDDNDPASLSGSMSSIDAGNLVDGVSS